MNNLSNCEQCNKIFIKVHKPICSDCLKKVDIEYQKCYEYLRKEKGKSITIYDLSEATKVSVKLINEFIREGRISIELLANISYPCISCKQLTQGGDKYCQSCRANINNELKEITTKSENINKPSNYFSYASKRKK